MYNGAYHNLKRYLDIGHSGGRLTLARKSLANCPLCAAPLNTNGDKINWPDALGFIFAICSERSHRYMWPVTLEAECIALQLLQEHPDRFVS